MERRRLGSTGAMVSPLAIGTWAFGGDEWGPADDARALSVIRTAVESGINLLDTADVYGYGHSERLLAQLLRDAPDDVLVCTKAGNDIYDTPQTAGGGPKNFTAEYLRRAVEGSLRRLGREQADIYLLHNPSEQVLADGEALGCLATLRDEGKIRHVGASVYTGAEVRAAVTAGAEVVMLPYSMLAQSEVATVLHDIRANDVGLLVRSPLANGLLSGRYSADSTFGPDDHRRARGPEWLRSGTEKAGRLRFLERDGRSLAQAALRFAFTPPEIASVVVGARTVEQLGENLAAAESDALTADELARISEIGGS